MRLVTIAAEMLLQESSFVFRQGTPAHCAVEIIQGMNITPFSDDEKKILGTIRSRKIEVIPAVDAITVNYRLEILLGGQCIYLQPYPQLDYNPDPLPVDTPTDFYAVL